MIDTTGPITKKSRRLRTDLVDNDKAFEHRPYPPGQHGRGRTKDSEYSLQLKEKQKARYAYGVLEKLAERLRSHPLPHWVERMTVGYLNSHGGAASRERSWWDLNWSDG